MSEEKTTDPARQDEAAPVDDGDQAVADYDWLSPQRFTQSQLDELEVFTRLASRRLSQTLTSMFRSDVHVSAGKPCQFFGSRLAQASIAQPEYWASINAAGSEQRVGYVSFAADSAGRWIANLLGAMASDVSEGQGLSSLEQDLLYDITVGMAQTFSDVLERACGLRIEATGSETFGELDFQESEEIDAFCKLTFTSEGDKPLETSFVISVDFLGAVVGAASPAKPDPAGSQAIQRELAAHLQHVPVVGHARLGSGMLTVRDMMELAPGDVVLIDRRADEPIDFLIKDKHVLSGYPCIAGLKYGLQIVADEDEPTADTDSPAAQQLAAE